MSSFKAYGKLDEQDQANLNARRKTRKRITIIALSSIILVAIVVAAAVGTTVRSNSKSGGGSKNPKSLSTSVKAVCEVTLYKDSCYRSLAPATANSTNLTPENLFKLSIQVAIDELNKTTNLFSKENFNDTTEKIVVQALENCRDLLGLAVDHLTDSLSAGGSVLETAEDLRTWLSSAGTCYETCIDGFEGKYINVKEKILGFLKNSTELTSNSLAIITWISKVAKSVKLRRLMSSSGEPEWLRSGDRKLLQNSENLKKKADFVVARDGSGKYRTIGAALKAVKEKNKKRTVIYVKKGVYREYVRVEKKKWNVLMVGDGKNVTIVTGSRNFVDGTPTFSTATFAVFGKGFVGRDMGFQNTAGPKKHQAVALMASADQVAFYRCRIDAFQDSLYAHNNRQFYRECDVSGTVDFIFGNSAVVLQNSNIFPRRPNPGQQNTITAQGKSDPNQNTGISIQNCTVSPHDDLSSVRTFLGRPWKNYSTTVFMDSFLGSLIEPSGWLPWTGNSAPKTIYYSEFKNFGPGSNTKYRVKWKGLRSISQKEAGKFSVKSFVLQGSNWISEARVPYKPSV